MNKSELQIIGDLVAALTDSKLKVTPNLDINNFTSALLKDLLNVVDDYKFEQDIIGERDKYIRELRGNDIINE